MAHILGRNRKVFAPGETHFFEDIWTRRKSLGMLDNALDLERAWNRLSTLYGRFNFPEAQSQVEAVVDKESIIERALLFGGGYGGLYLALADILCESTGKSYFCDDTPKHLFYLHEILSLLPSAKVIACIRDPRDFLGSYKYYWRRSTESNRVRALYHPIVTMLLWRSSANLLLRHATQCCRDRVLLTRYEDLVRNPSHEINRVCKFLGLDYSDAMMQIETHNSSFDVMHPSGIFSNSVGRWRQTLEPIEVWTAQAISGRKMILAGYDPVPIQPSMWALIGTLLTVPSAFLRALRANSAKRGPLIAYLMRRVRGIFG